MSAVAGRRLPLALSALVLIILTQHDTVAVFRIVAAWEIAELEPRSIVPVAGVIIVAPSARPHVAIDRRRFARHH